MTAVALVADLQARGVTLEPRGDRLAVRPVSRLTREEIEALRRHKAEVLALLRGPAPAEVARVLGLPLNQLDRVLEVRVPWLPVTLWFCPAEADATGLMTEGVSRGRIWTAAELLDLLGIPSITKAGVRTLAVAKLEFDGDVVEVRVRGVEGSPRLPGLEPAP